MAAYTVLVESPEGDVTRHDYGRDQKTEAQDHVFAAAGCRAKPREKIMFDAERENRITEQDIRKCLERGGWEAAEIVFSTNGENAFVLIGNHWQRMGLTDGWEPRDPVPGYIPFTSIEHFYDWIGEAREKEHLVGRRFGENAMRAAIRNLLGATPLVDLE